MMERSENEEEEIVESTRSDLDRAEDAGEDERLETLERVREKLESELEERDETPPA
jgi:hypothetical protein